MDNKMQQKCDELLEDKEIRFAGIISNEGKLLAGGFKEGIIPLENDSDRIQIYQELAARISQRKQFDSKLGRVKYSASRREKIVMISFPLNGNSLLIIAEPNVNIDRLAYRIIQKLGQEWHSFYGS